MPNIKPRKQKAQHMVDDFDTHRVGRLYEQSAPLLLAEALLFALVGVAMLWWPVGLLTLLMLIFGGALVLFGLYRMISGFVATRGYGGGWLDVFFGLVNVGLGVLFCVYPVGSMISVIYVFEILFLFKVLRVLAFAINMARVRFGHWVFNLIMAIVLVVLAGVLLFFPVAGAVAVVIYLAITLLVYAFADVYMFLELRRLKKVVAE